MSLYTTAQAESSFILASNLDSSTTENALKAGLTVSSSAFGTITQNASSLTGNASYDFSSNGSVLHQWSGSTSARTIIQEAVFKKSSAPTSGSSVLISSTGIKIEIQTNGTIRGFFRNGFNQTLNIASTANVCDGNWHHVVLAWNQGNDGAGNVIRFFRLYVDGTLIGDAATSVSDFGLTYDRYILIGGEYSGATRVNHFNGTIDFAAFYLPPLTLTAAQVDTFVANHVASYADKTVAADPATASSLAVDPTVTIVKNISVAADPATASATADGHYQTDIDLPLLLNQYMQSLNTSGYLEQWYKFDVQDFNFLEMQTTFFNLVFNLMVP
jgi:hypothetical protein